MRVPVLASVIFTTLALAGAVEFLSQKSAKQGGLSLSNSADDIPFTVTFSYLYGITIVAVLYSLLWTWVDLDIRRLQPWLELSRPGGANADSSLLLDYPFTFLAFIPFSAGRRRHWPVFFSGIASMLVCWGVTPLSSSIFGVKGVILVQDTAMTASYALPTLQEQSVKTDSSILNAAYGVTWLGQRLPAFTTPDYALVPFSPADSTTNGSPNETWTSTTTMFTTDLSCWPAAVTTVYRPHTLHRRVGSYGFDNGFGCATNVSMFQGNPFSNYSSLVLYIGYYEEVHQDYYLQGPTCMNSSAQHQFLAIWATADSTPNGYNGQNITAMFCEPSYWKQNVSVAVSAASGEPLAEPAVVLGSRTRLDETEFNATALEYLMGTGVPPVTTTRDYAASNTIEPWPTIARARNVSWPVTNMVTYALGLLDVPASDLQNASLFQTALSRAHRTVFSIAVSTLLSETGPAETKPGSVQRTLSGVVVSRPIAAVLEALLALVAFLAAAVLYCCVKSESKLSKDPAAIAFTLAVLKGCPPLLGRLATRDRADKATLKRSLAGQRFALDGRCPAQLREMEPLLHNAPDSCDESHRNGTEARNGIEYRPVRPRELHPFSGIILILLLLSGAVVLIYLKKREQELRGLPRPTDNFEVLQLLENYIPTVFATLLEPFLVLLTRVLCILQPFHDLRKGRCSPEKTLEARYTSLPPQLSAWRAFRSKHFLLGALASIALLVNALTVALGGTFNESSTVVEYPTTIAAIRGTNLTRDSIVDFKLRPNYAYLDHLYAVSSNLSANTTLPHWTTTRFAFLPVAATAGQRPPGSTGIFRIKTRGFGAEPNCAPLATSASTTQSFANLSTIYDPKSQISFMFRRENGTWTQCFPSVRTWSPLTEGKSAAELATSLSSAPYGDLPSEAVLDRSFCEDKMVLGWFRTTGSGSGNSSSNSSSSSSTPGALESSMIVCSAVLQTAMFDITADAAGNILTAEQQAEGGAVQGDDDDDVSPFTARNTSHSLLSEANILIANSGDSQWHNNTVTNDWLNYLLKLYLNGSTELVDPSHNVPAPALVVPAAQDLYRRLFAVLVGQNLDMFQLTTDNSSSSSSLAAGSYLETETRIFVAGSALVVSVAILCLDAAVLAVFYLRQRSAFLPRLPTSIASVAAYVAASRAVREYEGQGEKVDNDDGDDGDDDRSLGKGPWAAPARNRATYSFGRYVGVDGKAHVGIELDPLVMPVDGSMLHK
ncbi:hypothetical protein B0T24DRAFT_528532 [Lasiosphaeria ovina]|uniref:Uncharacterized protein n=1 Tax=Lasiosphaeria ovina TaxID=92902 RepID=A0AAE0KCT0_9PEZI|nr:hypothetical protein B0T24DRAFT_528532 [Lasiosphaeria ovina]